MPISPSEWDSRITEEARTQYLKDKYGQESVAVIDVLSDRPKTAFTARELLTHATPVPFIDHPVLNMHSNLDKPPVVSGPTVSDDSDAPDLDDDFVEKREIQTKTGTDVYYRLTSDPVEKSVWETI